MARLAHSIAMENDFITADCIEATEFPDLSNLYGVYAVPKTIVNGASLVEGAVPEQFFVDTLLNQLGLNPPKDETKDQTGSAS